MDENKRQKLRDIHYKISECCGLCDFGAFPSNDWGTCTFHTYDHQKHSDQVRLLSIHKFGSCKEFFPDQFSLIKLEKFFEFLKMKTPILKKE